MLKKIKLILSLIFGSPSRVINGPFVVNLVAKTENGYFAVDPEDMVVGRQLRMFGKYGTDEIEKIKPFISSESRILVVGAHIGSIVIPLSKHCKNIVAIEANPNNFDLLSKNLALNSVINCRAINVAASEKEEEIKFLLNRKNSGGSKRQPKNKKDIYYFDDPEVITVKAFGMDTFLDNMQFDIIIMDIEGSEFYALKGMQKMLSSAKVLFIEFLPHHLRNVSGVSVSEFLSLIIPHFSKLTVPTRNISVDKPDFLSLLEDMYNKDQSDESIIFEKE